MSTTDNPYTPPPPTTALDAESGAKFASNADVPRSVVGLLAATRPWVKLLSVLFFVFLGVAVLMMIVMSMVVPAGVGQAKLLPFIPVVVVMLLYIPPALYLWRYARGIQRLLDGGGQGALEEALSNQKSFWKFSGILGLVMVGIYALVLVGGVLAASLGSARGGS